MNETLHRLRFAGPLLLCALSALSACGGSSTPSGPPPTISDLTLTPTATVGAANPLIGAVRVVDEDGDESELDATITIPGGQSQAIPPTPLQGATGQTNAVINFELLFMPPVAGDYVVTVSVKDSDGVSSNTLTATVVAK